MKNYKGVKIAITAVMLALVVVLAGTIGVLIEMEVIKTSVSSFGVMLAVLLLGTGLYVTIYSLVVKGGYEFAIGSLLLSIGVVVLLIILKVFWAIILIVGIVLIALVFLGLLLLKAQHLHVERTNEKQGFVPYMEKLAKEKEQEKQEEENVPTIKSFKD